MTVWRVAALGRRGDGVIETEAGAAHAPFTLPGEEVRGAVADGRLAAPEIVTPSPSRRAPPCPHFGACGGCALQHADDAFLAEWKTERVRAALASVGLTPPLRPIHVSPAGARRRAVFTARRRKNGVTLGFHGRAAHRIEDVETCDVIDPRIAAALPALRALAGAAATRRGELRMHAVATESGLDVDLGGGRELDARLFAALGAIAEEADLARVSMDGAPVLTRRPPLLRMGGVAVTPPPAGFLQATADAEARLAEDVCEALAGARRVADLFSGCGAFTFALAERAAVSAVEIDAAALGALDAAARKAERLKPIATEARDSFLRDPLDARALGRFDGVVFDPPRAGAAAQAAEIARSGVAQVAAVSCNPESFARDARTLVDGGYRMLWARPVDQFRWSAHVEVTAAFARG